MEEVADPLSQSMDSIYMAPNIFSLTNPLKPLN